MIEEVAPKSKPAEQIMGLAQALIGKGNNQPEAKSKGSALAKILPMLRKK